MSEGTEYNAARDHFVAMTALSKTELLFDQLFQAYALIACNQELSMEEREHAYYALVSLQHFSVKMGTEFPGFEMKYYLIWLDSVAESLRRDTPPLTWWQMAKPWHRIAYPVLLGMTIMTIWFAVITP